MPRDRFGREIDYLRISVIDHCNLRCVYCMPLRGLTFVPAPDLLTAAEIETVARGAVSIGFRKFRLTGGEPTLRTDIVDIVHRIAAIPGVQDVAMTSNAVLLPQLAGPLKAAGLTRINIHVDTFHPERLKKIMRFGSLEEIEAGIAAAEGAGLRPIKINVVVTRDYNDMDVADVARRGLARGWQVRFIELMPLGGGDTAGRADAVRASRETRERIEAELGRWKPSQRARRRSVRNFGWRAARAPSGHQHP